MLKSEQAPGGRLSTQVSLGFLQTWQPRGSQSAEGFKSRLPVNKAGAVSPLVTFIGSHIVSLLPFSTGYKQVANLPRFKGRGHRLRLLIGVSRAHCREACGTGNTSLGKQSAQLSSPKLSLRGIWEHVVCRGYDCIWLLPKKPGIL